MTCSPHQFRSTTFARLRDGRRDVARLVLAFMIMPIWLTLMVSISPAAADFLGQSEGYIGSICTTAGVAGGPEDETGAVGKTNCFACHTAGCGMRGLVPTVSASLSAPLTGTITVFRTVETDIRGYAHDPPPSECPRAPPLA